MRNRTMAEVVQHREPVTLTIGTTVQEACLAMHERSASAALVLEGAALRGIFTSGDALRALALGLDPARTALGQAMTRDPCCLGAGDDALDALRLMEDGGFGHVPVVCEGRPLGVVSWTDFTGQERSRRDEENELSETMR
ncbi:CBS domain-containing protein [Roseococcus sp. SYP-B2431]|uniref:CBS domain-containing protein n=1 Tax=Roseococcus sp. SYP-B2431 TaxID=2496640 RepID=UPI00103DE819|nr:CBS domain-containing protein [Roseococcus sp. SYP-B2431]TCH98815.1 CBS domain-containing protein [Roseococcus sp. SYP-B2431]